MDNDCIGFANQRTQRLGDPQTLEHPYPIGADLNAGPRRRELRLPLQHSQPPSEAYAGLIEDLARLDATPERLAALYDALLPGLERRYDGYAAEADPVLDAPSLVILERVRQDLARQRVEADRLRSQLSLPMCAPDAWRRREAGTELLA